MKSKKHAIYEQIADDKYYLLLEQFNSTQISSHFHKSYEFVYCLSGKTEVFVNGEKRVLSGVEAYCASSYDIHYNSNVGDNLILAFVFSDEYIKDFKVDFGNAFFDRFLLDKNANKIIFSYLQEFYNNNPNYKEDLYINKKVIVNQFLSLLSKYYKVSIIQESEKEKVVLQILKYINEHFKEDLTLISLSKKFSYTPQYFSALFNKHIGMSLNNYINNYRIIKIKEILATGDRNITEVALDCGFKSIATYYRALNKYR